MLTIRSAAFVIAAVIFSAGCIKDNTRQPPFSPTETIDLGALVTADLPERVWGEAFLEANGLNRPNEFEIINWTVELGGGKVSGSNAFYTLANHGGPHVDAPNHIGVGSGLDSYSVEQFSGPLKTFDVSDFTPGRTVTKDIFENTGINAGDIVLIYTGYKPPSNDESIPGTVTLTRPAAEYLADIPIKAFGTDSLSVDDFQEQTPVDSENPAVKAAPIHYTFLARGIPVYEQLFNVDRTLDKKRMYFVGAPLNIREGDGMLVRPVVFVY